MTENLEIMTKEDKEQIETTLAMGDAIPDLVISCIYKGVVPQVQEALKAKGDKDKITDKAKELFVKAMTQSDEDCADKYFKADFEDDDGRDVIQLKDCDGVKAEDIARYLSTCMSAVKAKCQKDAEALFNPPKKKGGAKKTSGTRRKAGDADEWFKNTVEEAQAEYKKGVWASAQDIEEKTTYKEQMKIYKEGDKDPRGGGDEGKTLVKDLVKYQYKAVIRTDNIQDKDDATRCRGAVSYKAGRYGSAYASKKGFKGAVMASCSAKAKAGGFCDKCAINKLDYFNPDNKYTKAKIAWCEAWVDAGVFKQV